MNSDHKDYCVKKSEAHIIEAHQSLSPMRSTDLLQIEHAKRYVYEEAWRALQDYMVEANGVPMYVSIGPVRLYGVDVWGIVEAWCTVTVAPLHQMGGSDGHT